MSGLDDSGRLIGRVLDTHDPEATAERVRAMREERRAYAEAEARGGLPVYEVPTLVRERFPDFDPARPDTWPEPDKCTEGRPWGLDAYGSVWGGVEDRWRLYLAGRASRLCRNRWKRDDLRLCGTHANTYLARREEEQRRADRYAREDVYRDLAKRLAAHGIEGDAGANGVLLRRDAIEALLVVLDQHERESLI